MENNIFIKGINIIYFILLIYSLLFIGLHFFYPNIDELTITLSPSPTRLESRVISIMNPKVLNSYYLLIYEDSADENWLYFNSSPAYSSHPNIIKSFLPESKTHYLLLEGNKHKSNFNFTITPKYPIGYMATKEHIFHVQYIVPFRVFPFPTFYYSKHYIFFVDPLI